MQMRHSIEKILNTEEGVLSSAKRQLKNILDTLSEAVITVNGEGKIVYCNQKAEEVFQIKKERMLLKDVDILVPERYRDKHREAIKSVVQRDGHPILGRHVEVMARRGDGSEFPIEISITRWSDNNTLYFTTVIKDISHRLQLERQLTRAKKEAETYLNVAGVMLLAIGPDERVKMINRKGAEILEASVEEIVGKNWFDNFIPEDSRQESRRLFRLQMSGNTASVIFSENPVLTSKGNLRIIRWFTSILRDDNGLPDGTLSSGEDITEQKRIEEELLRKHLEMTELFKEVERAKREWEASLDCLNDIIILTDSSGRVVRCNQRLSQLTGLTYKEIVGRYWEELLKISGFDAETLFNTSVELIHRATGRTFSLNSYHLTLKDIGTDITNVITLHETTELNKLSNELKKKNQELASTLDELKQTQSQMVQNEKMASIGQLAAGVAHEINNPMGFIYSNLSTLSRYLKRLTEYLNTVEEALPPEVSEHMNKERQRLKIDFILKDISELIKESLDGAERVKKIVSDLKSFSRVDEAKETMADINECIESTLNIVWNELKYKAKVVKDYGVIPATYCNPQQLNQVFMNLLVNAAHAIQKQGEITIKTWHDGGYIYTAVTDTGCGMTEEVKNRIFEPFFTTKEVGRGTGLGLSIAYDIVVKKHEGEITVESEPGRGTTFTVKIPVKQSP